MGRGGEFQEQGEKLLRPQIRGRMGIRPENYQKEGRKFYRLAAEHKPAKELGLSYVASPSCL